MTKVTKIITALLAISLAFTSCSSDDDVETELLNQIEYDENISSLSSNTVTSYGTGVWHAGYNLDLKIKSSNYTTTTGTELYFELATLSSSEINSGSYTFFNNPTSTNVMPTGRYTDNTKVRVNGSSDRIVTGALTVSKSGDLYTYEFSGTTVDGKSLRFNYSGVIPNNSVSRRSPSDK